MSLDPLHENTAIAVDGGGIKGLIVVRALVALEEALGVESLIELRQLKVLSGTSTGAIITAAIAVGMGAQEITDLYLSAGRTVFPPLLPAWIPSSVLSVYKRVLGLFKPAVYPNDTLKKLLRDAFARQTGDPDITLGDLKKRLREDQALIITVADILARRTRFLKTYDDKDGDWKLWEAVMASSAAPTLLPVLERPDSSGKIRYYTDGGVGSYANPAYVAARETVEWQKYDPSTVSVLSFGTGWVDEKNFERAVGKPSSWKILDWATNAILLMLGDADRAQSLDVIYDYVVRRMDFRRFQILLGEDIGMDDTSEAAMTRMLKLGEVMGERIVNNQHALGKDPGFDPEGLRQAVIRYRESLRRRRETSG